MPGIIIFGSIRFSFICSSVCVSLGYLLHAHGLFHFLGQGNDPVLSSLIKLHCVDSEKDLSFSCVE